MDVGLVGCPRPAARAGSLGQRMLGLLVIAGRIAACASLSGGSEDPQ